MEYQGLRDWLARVEEMGELKRVSGVELVDEMGALFELARSVPGQPALLVDDIPGYPSGYRIASTGLSPRRFALTMGLPLETNIIKLTDRVRRMIGEVQRIPPTEVKDGPVLENVIMGDDVNMHMFPAPKWHEMDGGNYLGTADVIITKDPDEGWVNLGTYRVQVHDRDTLGFYISPGKHGRIIREKYWAKGEPCPVAMCFGQDPLLLHVGSTGLPWGASEYDYAGGIKGQPVEVIKGPVTGLPIPADAEIVIEGLSYPGDMHMEGPFGEFAGYYASGERKEPIVKVKSILHRNNPIVLGAPPMRPLPGAMPQIMRASAIWNALERAGIPDIVGVAGYQAFFVTVIAVKQRYPGHAKQVATVASNIQGNAYCNRWVITVDEDIDPANWDDVLWALATRCDPEISINVLNRCWSTPLDPMARPGLADDGPRVLNSRAIVDACIPYELQSRKLFPPVVGSSPELREKTEAKFLKLLTS